MSGAAGKLTRADERVPAIRAQASGYSRLASKEERELARTAGEIDLLET